MKRFVTLIRVDVTVYATLIGQLEGIALMVTLPSTDAAIPVTFLMSRVTMEAILDAVELSKLVLGRPRDVRHPHACREHNARITWHHIVHGRPKTETSMMEEAPTILELTDLRIEDTGGAQHMR